MEETSLQPEPVTLERVRERLVSKRAHVFVDDDGDLGVFLYPHFYFIVQEGSKPFLATATYHREFELGLLEECTELAQEHNRAFFLPKLTTEISDEGMILFRVSHCFNWLSHATDEQLDEEMNIFASAAVSCFRNIAERFPDGGDQS